MLLILSQIIGLEQFLSMNSFHSNYEYNSLNAWNLMKLHRKHRETIDLRTKLLTTVAYDTLQTYDLCWRRKKATLRKLEEDCNTAGSSGYC